MTTVVNTIDEERLNNLVGRAVGDLGAVASAVLVVIGDQLGLYATLRDRGASSVEELAEATGTSSTYLRPWLINQAAGGYVDYDADSDQFSMSAEQVLVFANDESPAALAGGFALITSLVRDAPSIIDSFRSGKGFAWSEHDEGLFGGTARFFKPGYVDHLVRDWIPALTGVQDRLDRGAIVADVGCGHGVSTIILAQAFPNSRFIGFDSHAPSIEAARHAARLAGVGDRVTFEVARSTDFPGSEYDLVALFDCLHDMGHPGEAVAYIRSRLATDGAVLLVEPMAGETIEENLNPIGRIFSAASVMVCSPHALSEGGEPIGTLATEAQLRRLFDAAGYASFRRATETPTNRIFEARA